MTISNITTGWLKKETNGALKRFERRWVVVSGTYLSYYKKDDNSAQALGVIDLPGMKISIVSEAEYKFGLTDKDNTFNFSCDSKSEMEKWIDAISCISYAPYGGGMFGSSVEMTVKREKVHGGGNIPKILSQCIGYLDTDHRLRENGIFRLAGNEKSVKLLKMDFQEGREPNLNIRGDTHTVGSLLKLYLRSLPDSVIPSSLYEDFIAISLTYEFSEVEGLNELRHLINRLPITNYNTLRRLCTFLHKVQTYSDLNRMDLSNLAIVFSPTILKNNSGDLNLEMSDMQKLKGVVEIMIKHHATLFPKDKVEEEQDAVDLENIDHEELKNLYTVKMIKYQVTSKEVVLKDLQIQKLKDELLEAERTIQEHQNTINSLEGYIQRLESKSANTATRSSVSPVPPPRSQSTHLTSATQSPDPAVSPQLRRRSPVQNRPPIRPRPLTMVDLDYNNKYNRLGGPT